MCDHCEMMEDGNGSDLTVAVNTSKWCGCGSDLIVVVNTSNGAEMVVNL